MKNSILAKEKDKDFFYLNDGKTCRQRQDIIDNIRSGEEEYYVQGSKVHVVSCKSGFYLRTDGNAIEEDNLENLKIQESNYP